MFFAKTRLLFWYQASNIIPGLLLILSITVFLPGTGDVHALELSGILSLEGVIDSIRIDFSELDTPMYAIGFRQEIVSSPDMILTRQFLIRAPYTPNLDSTSINTGLFSFSLNYNVDSLRRILLPVAASVNPECRQSGQCDTAGGGFFIRTSENGVAFFRQIGMYIGGIDRYYFFWAYSSDGTFGGNTEILQKPEKTGINVAVPLRGSGYTVYDLQGRKSIRDERNNPDKSLRNMRLVIMENGKTGESRAVIGVER